MMKKIFKILICSGILFCSAFSFLNTSGNENLIAAHAKNAEPCFRETKSDILLPRESVDLDIYFDNFSNIKSYSFECHYDSNLINITSISYPYDDAIYDANLDKPGIALFSVVSSSYIRYDDFKLQFSINNPELETTTNIRFICKEMLDSQNNYVNYQGENFTLNFTKDHTEPQPYFYISGQNNIGLNETIDIELYMYGADKLNSSQMVITYDKNYFDATSLVPYSNIVDGGLYDINLNQKGFVNISFVLNNLFESNIGTLRLKCIKEFEGKSFIFLRNIESLDSSSNSIYPKEGKIELTFKKDSIEHKNKIYLSGTNNIDNTEAIVKMSISSNTNLGAGDFILTFDTKYLQFKEIKIIYKVKEGQYFNYNLKQLDRGIIKLSIISTFDIVEASDLYAFYFTINDNTGNSINTMPSLESSSLTDSNSKQIYLSTDVMGEILIPHNIHTWSDWNVITSATCDKNGLKRHYCKICGTYEDEIIPMLNHEKGPFEVIKEPTYLYEGSKKTTCQLCGKEIIEPVDRLLNDAEYKEICTFAEEFLKANVCGTDDNTKANSELFMSLKSKYLKLSENVKIALKNIIIDSNPEHVVEIMLEKYDRIMYLHNANEGHLFENYFSRPIHTHLSQSPIVYGNNYTFITHIAISIFVSLAFIVFSLFCYKRKKFMKK